MVVPRPNPLTSRQLEFCRDYHANFATLLDLNKAFSSFVCFVCFVVSFGQPGQRPQAQIRKHLIESHPERLPCPTPVRKGAKGSLYDKTRYSRPIVHAENGCPGR